MKYVSLSLVAVALAACGVAPTNGDAGDAAGAGDARSNDAAIVADASTEDPLCETGGLEPDFAGEPLQGSGVDASGRLAPGSYVLSTTRIRSLATLAARQRFQALMGGIMPTLATAPGLVAVSFGGSQRCATGRTLTVWRDEASMFAWVHTAPHQEAINSVREVSRGGSRVTHWNGDATQATWVRAAEVLRDSRGPEY